MPRKVLSILAIVLLWAAVQGSAAAPAASDETGRPDKPASAYHFIGAYSRDRLIVREVLMVPAGLDVTTGQETGGASMRLALPPGARVLEGSEGVALSAGAEGVPSELVLDFSRERALSWTFEYPLTGGTVQIVRRLPLPVEFASVMLEAAGPRLEVQWPEAARETETSFLPSHRSGGRDFITSTARQVPARSPITIRISSLPDLSPSPPARWPLWAVLAMGVLTGITVLRNHLKRAGRNS